MTVIGTEGTAQEERRSLRAPLTGPWPEPWRPGPGARPRAEYWDPRTATWLPCPPEGRPPEGRPAVSRRGGRAAG